MNKSNDLVNDEIRCIGNATHAYWDRPRPNCERKFIYLFIESWSCKKTFQIGVHTIKTRNVKSICRFNKYTRQCGPNSSVDEFLN